MKKSVSRNYIYNIAYQILGIIVPLITTPYISRTLLPEGVGIYSYTFSVATYFGIIGSLGVDLYGQMEISRGRGDLKRRSQTFVELVISRAITIIVSFIVYYMITCRSDYAVFFRILTAHLLAQIVDIAWFYHGMEEFGKTVGRNALIKIISVILIFILVKKPDHLIRYILIIHGSTILGNVVLWHYLPDYIDVHLITRIELRKLIKHWKKSFVYFIPSITATVYTSFDKSMLNWIIHSDAENGYYEQSYKIYTILTNTINSLSVVLLPRLTYLWSNLTENRKKINSIIYRVFNYAGLISFGMAFGLCGIAENFVPLFFGNEFYPCIPILRVFSFMIILAGFANLLGHQCLMSRGKQKEYNICAIISATINIIFNMPCISMWKALGAALATIISESILVILFIYNSREVISYSTLLALLWKKAVAGIIMCSVIVFIGTALSGWIGMIIQIIVGFITYYLLLKAMKDNGLDALRDVYTKKIQYFKHKLFQRS